MFQPQSTPFSSSSFFSSLPSSHGIDFAPLFGLPQPAHAGEREFSPTHAGHQQQYLAHTGVATGSLSSSCATDALHPQQQYHPGQQLPPRPPSELSLVANRQQQHSPSRSAPSMEESNSHDMAAQQEAAKDYRPKLQALPQTYSHYRPIRGDGNCGWRAIGFSYFESLIERGDQAQIEGEFARLKSLNHLLATVGEYNYFEDFADEAFDLLREIARIIDKPAAAHALLHQKWNDAAVEGSLIFYLRLLAATFLKANAETYAPFIPGGQGVDEYCSHNIETVNREIEQLGIVALVNILLKPVNFVLEIAYLDRSTGSQVNQYRFPEEANGKDASSLGTIIYLLYRPDHYDILYRTPTVTTSPPPVSLQVNRVTGFTHNTAFNTTGASMGAFSTVDFGALSMIPGLSTGSSDGLAGLMSMPAVTAPTNPIIGDAFSSSQQAVWMPQYGTDIQSTKGESPAQPPPAVATVQHPSPSPLLTPTTPMSSNAPMMPPSTNMGPQQLPPHMATPGATGYPIRFSTHQLEYENNSFPEPTFQVTTNTFKNSVWNRAHYGNPDFQPEEWNPEEDGAENRLAGKRKVRKDSS
ncbi:ubiquitin thiolesterase [Metarhizium acridum CQMa 102]|uniref:ubiquitinyl hydrolase 1 n=1 Tax=Metarhizium acridum (strain CQMa 102) TaxID=655827 RepID=E9EAH3_METAQ|nr:ubiquitin thiolesterase [Metarhizium acridum CQMa 102]EFY87082.1 ubiquitin thiolesterase [Metarhizium acridum CQMa 102]